jgi:hypothetical protein
MKKKMKMKRAAERLRLKRQSARALRSAAAALDVELGERLGEGRLHGGGFFATEFVALQGLFGAFHGSLGGTFVDGSFLDGHIGKDVHAILRDFDKPFADREVGSLASLMYDQLARMDLCHQRDVHREDAHLTLDRRDDDHIDFVAKSARVGGDDFKAKSGHGLSNQYSVIGDR